MLGLHVENECVAEFEHFKHEAQRYPNVGVISQLPVISVANCGKVAIDDFTGTFFMRMYNCDLSQESVSFIKVALINMNI